MALQDLCSAGRYALVVLSFCLVYVQLASAASLPLKARSVQELGLANDPDFNPEVRRDCGGGGFINGQYFIGFCDSATVGGPSHDRRPTSLAHNSFATFGQRNASDPTRLTNYGTILKPDEGQFPPLVGPNNGNESDPSLGFAVWPSSNYIPSADGKSAIGVMTCMNALPEANWSNYYTTLVSIDVVDPNSLPASNRVPKVDRIVPRFFYPSEIHYGSFSLFPSKDGFTYLLATSKSDTHGLVAARVPPADIADRTAYTYWTGRTWSSAMPRPDDVAANFLNFTGSYGTGPHSGELFYSRAHDRLVLVLADASVSGTFYATHLNVPGVAPRGGPAAPAGWAEPVAVYTPPVNGSQECNSGHMWNYAGHSYPDWFVNGESLLVSWSSCESWIYMARIDWA